MLAVSPPYVGAAQGAIDGGRSGARSPDWTDVHP